MEEEKTVQEVEMAEEAKVTADAKEKKMKTIADMVRYAKEHYGNEEIHGNWSTKYYQAWYQKIDRKVKNLIHTEGTGKIELASPLADFIIDNIMFEYFLTQAEAGKDSQVWKNRNDRIRKRKEERLKKLQEKSAQRDEERNKRNEEMAEEYYSEWIERQESLAQSGNLYSDEEEEFCYLRVTSEEERQKEERRGNVVLSNDAVIPGDILRYSLPTIFLDDMTEEHVQKIVDRMMLRAVFGLFFDFKEQEFCTDLFERASRIYVEDDVIKYQTGYDALTRELENPKHYIKKKPRR